MHAHDNLEILLASILGATLRRQVSRWPTDTLARWDEAMTCISDAARAAYRALVATPGLPEFFSAATPVDELAGSTSGPGRRTDPAQGQPPWMTCGRSRGCSAGRRPG
jgi:phosphoenolpyruvate carboxylase